MSRETHTPNGLHHGDMTVIGDLEHGGHRFSVAHLTHTEAPRRVQWYSNGTYASGSPAKAAAALAEWFRFLPPGPRMVLSSRTVDVALQLRRYAEGAK